MSRKHTRKQGPATVASQLRIVGGKHRGRTILYDGDPRTRPMKDRVREAVFNLVGPTVKAMHVWDLFGGTGAMALEAISRGARSATIVERSFTASRVIQQNVTTLGENEVVDIVTADTFIWWRNRPSLPPEGTWLLFCCPPYAFFVDREQQMLELIESLIRSAPRGSLAVAEFDRRFDPQKLPQPEEWDVRTYPPATVAIFEIEG